MFGAGKPETKGWFQQQTGRIEQLRALREEYAAAEQAAFAALQQQAAAWEEQAGKANVGIAISDGAAIAREIADITIAADDLHELVSLRRIAGKLTVRIRSNYRFVMGFNGSLIALGAFGVLPPATSAMLHNLSTLGVSLRSMTNLLEPS